MLLVAKIIGIVAITIMFIVCATFYVTAKLFANCNDDDV